MAGDSIRFGSVAEDIPAVMHQRLIPLTNYLSDAVGKHVVLKLSPDMPGAIAALAAGDVELAYLTPVAYIRSHESGNTRLLVKTVTDNQGFFRLMIVVRSDSPIKTVADLAGKRFAFGDPAALLQLAVVANAGVNMDKLGTRAYLGHYDNIVRGILNRDYDAGIVTDMKVHRWAGKGLRVIYSSPELPPYNIAATHKLDDVLFTKLQKALLRLDSKNPQDRQVLSALGEDYNGFAPTSDHEYDIVRDLIKPFRQ